MTNLTRSATIAAAAGGSLWTFKALVITARDGSFDPLESVVFIGGLLCILTATVLFAIVLSRRARGVARVGVGIAAGVGLFTLALLTEFAGKELVAGLASGNNLGLEEEGGILCVGLLWLALAAANLRSHARMPVAHA
jgi:uncharacterized membrane protein